MASATSKPVNMSAPADGSGSAAIADSDAAVEALAINAFRAVEQGATVAKFVTLDVSALADVSCIEISRVTSFKYRELNLLAAITGSDDNAGVSLLKLLSRPGVKSTAVVSACVCDAAEMAPTASIRLCRARRASMCLDIRSILNKQTLTITYSIS